MHGNSYNAVEEKLLKALQHNDRATLTEIAVMVPSDSKDQLAAAKANLEKAKLVEPVPGSTTGQLRLTAKGAEEANDLPDDDSSGSGGGGNKFA